MPKAMMKNILVLFLLVRFLILPNQRISRIMTNDSAILKHTIINVNVMEWPYLLQQVSQVWTFSAQNDKIDEQHKKLRPENEEVWDQLSVRHFVLGFEVFEQLR